MNEQGSHIHNDSQAPLKLPFSEVMSALSYALDLTEGQPPGHCLRCCWIGFHIGQELGLNSSQLQELYYTLLLKDAGCSSNAARLFQLYGTDDLLIKNNFKRVDSQSFKEVATFVLSHTGLQTGMMSKFKKLLKLMSEGDKLTTELIVTRCYKGASIAKRFGLSNEVANGIRYLDEHYNGKGQPTGIQKDRIPLYSRIALLSQVVDVFHQVAGKQAAIEEIQKRNGTWFDPKIVQCFIHLAQSTPLLDTLSEGSLEQKIMALEPQERILYVTDEQLDKVVLAFAEIIDSKSPFTFGHSTRVREYTCRIARYMNIPDTQMNWLSRAALLHDIGKLGVSNSILDKPGKLTDEEFTLVKKHTVYTEEILSRITLFKDMAQYACAHHERLDGKGYHKGLQGDDVCIEARILMVADIFDALTADRPYRKAMDEKKALSILNDDRGIGIDDDCLDALRYALKDIKNS